MKNYRKWLFIITLAYFALGLVNILFAWLALVCMGLPLYFLFRDTNKTWCQKYCPRASLMTGCGKLTQNCSLNTPKYFIKGKMKWIMLGYFVVSLFFITMSTIKVSKGIVEPMYYLRYLIFLKIPFEVPQLIDISGFSQWVYHFGYRMYSMMLTTTSLGLILALIYKPRTWCTICPIATVSQLYIDSKKA